MGFAVASPLVRSNGAPGPAPALPAQATRAGQGLPGVIHVNSGKSFAQKQEELSALLAGTSAEDCALALGNLLGGYGPSCYGPSIDYQNHPDSGDGLEDGRLPGGDLGLWSETEGTSEPCAAVKLTSLVNNVGDKVDYGLYMAASMVCLMNVNGIALPDADASEDLTALVDESLATNNPGIQVNDASLARLADDDGDAVYQYSVNLDFSPEGPQVFTIDTTLEHVSDADAPGDHHGSLHGVIGGFDDFLPVQAYSVAYERSDEHLRYGLLLASFEAGAGAVFDDAGMIDIGGDWQGNLNQGIFDLDAESGSIGEVSFAWQAGRGDSHTRVFNVFVAPEDAGMAGCGFFGFGPRFESDFGSVSDASISTFICNWAGPGNDHEGRVGFAQKQCFQSEGTGAFEVTESHIAYAPVNDCDSTADDFGWKTVDDSVYDDTPIAVDLVELSSDIDHAGYAGPVPPAHF